MDISWMYPSTGNRGGALQHGHVDFAGQVRQPTPTPIYAADSLGSLHSERESWKSAAKPPRPNMRRTMSSAVGPTPREPTKKPVKEKSTKTGPPQPNWRPFVMRWPYLLFLMFSALALGIGVEGLYRQSAVKPVVVFTNPEDIPSDIYFAVKFAPMLVAVLFGILWQMTDIEVRRLEAFHQLSKPEGALADQSLSVDYTTFFSFFRALKYRHYAVFLSSVASLLANTLVPTLGSASIVLLPGKEERLANPGVEKTITINPVWSRLLIAILFLSAFLGYLLLWMLQDRRSGLAGDVKGIAGVASMAVVSHVLMDFKDMDVATHQEIHNQLKGRRYALCSSSLAPIDSEPIMQRTQQSIYVMAEPESSVSQNPHPLMLRPAGCFPLIFSIIAFFMLFYLVLFTKATALTESAPWVVTMMAVCVKMGWAGLDADLRMMEPYYILWRRHAPPGTLTLDYTNMPVGWVAVKALYNRHFLIFFVGFGTVMSEVLTVVVASLTTVSGHNFMNQESINTTARHASAGQETKGSFWTSVGLVSFILLYMAIVAIAVFVKRGRPFLPRQPNSIANVLAYIHQSKMVIDFAGTSKQSRNEKKKHMAELSKTYGVGWFLGRDGLTHCGVDEEELLDGFTAGSDLTKHREAV